MKAPGRHPVHQNDALVALAHLRQIALHDHGLAIELGEKLEQRVEILVSGRDVEDARPAIAEQGLDDDVLVHGAEDHDLAPVARDQRLGHEIGEMRDEKLFRRVAHMGRIVHDERLRVNVLQNVCRRDVAHVEGRVLAHEHDVEGGKIEGLLGPEREMIAAGRAHAQGARAGADAVFPHGEVARQVIVQLVPARLGLERQGEGRVRGDVDPLDGVHLDRDRKRHRPLN